MSSNSSISQAVPHICQKWPTAPDADDTSEAPSASSSALGDNEPGDEICPSTRKWPNPGPHPGQSAPGGGEMIPQGCAATKGVRPNRRQRRSNRV